MRFAYADPPYLGCGKLYPEHPDARDWDDLSTHKALVARLCDEYADGWALSLSTPSLQAILPMCPADVRIAAWVKPFASFTPNTRIPYTWEPVIWRGGRQSKDDAAPLPTVRRDHLSERIVFGQRLPGGLPGAKPERFCRWVADLLGYDADRDVLDDLFPGTGVMGRVLSQGVLV